MRPQHGPNAQPQQTSRLIEPLGSFGKLQVEELWDSRPRTSCTIANFLGHYIQILK